jgi:hypothetical protein
MQEDDGAVGQCKKQCFVLMPIADVTGYDIGHFSRVYEHLIKPSISLAGYSPIRSDDTVKTDYIAVGIVQKIVDSEVILCDISAKNPNVMYELGIAHSFNKKVVLIKDEKTGRVFDIQGLRTTDYDSSLRIDNVQKDISRISASLTETSENGDINSIIQLANIRVAELPKGQEISADTQLLMSRISSIEETIESFFNSKKSDELYFTGRFQF